MKCLRHRPVPDHNVGLNPIRLKACHQFFCHLGHDCAYRILHPAIFEPNVTLHSDCLVSRTSVSSC